MNQTPDTLPNSIAVDDVALDGPVADLRYVPARELRGGDVWISFGEERKIDSVRTFPSTDMVQFRIRNSVVAKSGYEGMWVLREVGT